MTFRRKIEDRDWIYFHFGNLYISVYIFDKDY